MKYISLLRHGVTASNATFPGPNTKLTPLGWQQMGTRLEQLSGVQFVISSPYARCEEFARQAASQHDIKWKTDARIAEFNVGEWTDKPTAELMQLTEFNRFSAQPFRADHDCLPAGSESFTQFSNRILAALHDIQLSHHEHTLLITHGGVIRFILLHVLKAPLEAWYKLRVEFGSLTRLCMADDGWLEILHHQGEKP
ncbi:MAG TPA: histidine phosphatase family protein [Pseudomonadales bacterium]|nr:histidine phosphatase family protein [Pseudomonadales bacterium]